MIGDYGGKVILFGSSWEREICETISSLMEVGGCRGCGQVLPAEACWLLAKCWVPGKLQIVALLHFS